MGYKILLVEDNPHIMEINTEALEMEDYEVFQAVDGKSCMELLRSKEPDMVVLDIMLPDTDGLKLCREIKAKADIPILFLSALSENRQIV
ncbi:MAG: response regulator, partial [Lachnospiraceae bacterium]|nr:response regulator [Lachnospiraceae bacterium]